MREGEKEHIGEIKFYLDPSERAPPQLLGNDCPFYCTALVFVLPYSLLTTPWL